MIRKISRKIMILAGFAVCLAGMPVLVQADIFLKPNNSQQEKKEPEKKSFRSYLVNPFKKKGKSKDESAVYHSGRKVDSRVVYRDPLYKPQSVDQRLLSQAGPEPRTAKELMAVASAHKASKINAMRQMKAINAVFVDHKIAQYEQKSAMADLRRERIKEREAQRAAYEAAQQESRSGENANQKKKIYLTPSSVNLNRPKKVFNRNR